MPVTHWSWEWARVMDLSSAMIRRWPTVCDIRVGESQMSETPTCPVCREHRLAIEAMLADLPETPVLGRTIL